MQAVKQHVLETDRLLLRAFNPEIQQQVMSTLSDEELKAYFGFTSNEQLNT